jgi:hypothetical protein
VAGVDADEAMAGKIEELQVWGYLRVGFRNATARRCCRVRSGPAWSRCWGSGGNGFSRVQYYIGKKPLVTLEKPAAAERRGEEHVLTVQTGSGT